MIGALLLLALLAVAVALVSHLREPAPTAEVSECALCGRRGLRQQWLAWHHEASHGEGVEG